MIYYINKFFKNIFKNHFKNKYRVVEDNYSGYEAQVKKWYFPVWLQIGFINTSPSIEGAKKHCEIHAKKLVINVEV